MADDTKKPQDELVRIFAEKKLTAKTVKFSMRKLVMKKHLKLIVNNGRQNVKRK